MKIHLREGSCSFGKCLSEKGWELGCSFSSPARSAPKKVNYARDCTGSIKFLSSVSLAGLSFTAAVLLGAGGVFSVSENSEFPEKPLRAPAWRRSSHQTSFPLIKKVGTLDSMNSLVRIVERSYLSSAFNPFLFVTFAYFICVSYSQLWQTWNSFAETYRRITALFSNFSILF